MGKVLSQLLAVCALGGLALISTSSVKAVTITTSSTQTSIFSSNEYIVDASVSAEVADGTQYYLRGEFFKPGTSNYCGYTWNETSWYNGPYSGTGFQNLRLIKMASNLWSGQVKAKFDPASSGCNTSGVYNFRILRYSSGGNPQSGDTQTPLSVDVTIGTPTPSSSPIETQSPTPTATERPTNCPTPASTPKPHKPRGLKCRMSYITINVHWLTFRIPQLICGWEQVG